MSDERERVADELRRIRDEVRERALLESRPGEILPPAAPLRTPEKPEPIPEPPPPEALPRPDGTSVNAVWDVGSTPGPGGLKGHLLRLLRRVLEPLVQAQVTFNSRQVQLDNEILAYLDARLDGTHRHYDHVLGLHGRHMAEIDERHLILQEEVVAHVHDLVKRIDLVLSEAERGRLSVEFAIRDVQARLARLEERLKRG